MREPRPYPRKLIHRGAIAVITSLLFLSACPEAPAPGPDDADGGWTAADGSAGTDSSADASASNDAWAASDAATGADTYEGSDAGADGFNDHTRSLFDDAATLLRFMATGVGRSQAKFIITAFTDAATRGAIFMEGAFFAMHDEWYWFRLLNGYPAPGSETTPVEGLAFDSLDQIRAWARTQEELPLDLRWVGDGRLYSPEFYEMGLSDPRTYGLGSVVYLPARQTPEPRDEQWLFELEYVDSVSHDELVVFFEALADFLPGEIADTITWVTRSPNQAALAQAMIDQRLAYWDRTTSYDELTVPGEAEVYNPGITAGRLAMVQPGDPGIGDTGPDDIVVLGEVPDFLPPAAALLTSVPQTPLAHINILARNRGIPNAYVAGIIGDPDLDQLARASAPVLVYAEAPDRVVIQPLSYADYNTYRGLLATPEVAVPPVELEGAPLTVDLEEVALAEMDDLRPLIGGKSAGFLALLDQIDDGDNPIAVPPDPLAITIRPYVEHVAPLRPLIETMLDDEDFRRDARVRLLVLEGPEDFDARYPSEADLAFRERFVERRPPGEVLGDMVRGGGLKRVIRDRPMEATTLAQITATLQGRFGHYATTQGLRFRSSSNVEDIEGFNGAGLYNSNTGYLDAEAHPDEDQRKRTVEWAIKKTWASYWAAEALEERRLGGVDHLSGAMGVLVHARFDDPLEVANGVFTVTLQRIDDRWHTTMEINSQRGALSVTNPETQGSSLPEVTVVEQHGIKGPITVARLQPSTEGADGSQVLFDHTLERLLVAARDVTHAWLAEENRARGAWQRSTTQTLDFEYRLMAPGWPALASGTARPARLIVKQARSLEPGLGRLPMELRDDPVPVDILARARRIDRRVCANSTFSLLTLEVYTDPNLAPDLGYGEHPFNSYVSISFYAAVPDLDIAAEHRFAFAHPDYAQDHPSMAEGSWDLWVQFLPGAASVAGFTTLDLHTDGVWVLIEGDQYAIGGGTRCSVTSLFSTPEDFLLGLLE